MPVSRRENMVAIIGVTINGQRGMHVAPLDFQLFHIFTSELQHVFMQLRNLLFHVTHGFIFGGVVGFNPLPA